mmetsp:Transcript_13637/g.41212  ORF Transcript_13637/g.41212 Transcript_13637/m.41212 type:complete len:272 (-) Transcript_13637:2530-3345(-)
MAGAAGLQNLWRGAHSAAAAAVGASKSAAEFVRPGRQCASPACLPAHMSGHQHTVRQMLRVAGRPCHAMLCGEEEGAPAALRWEGLLGLEGPSGGPQPAAHAVAGGQGAAGLPDGVRAAEHRERGPDSAGDHGQGDAARRRGPGQRGGGCGAGRPLTDLQPGREADQAHHDLDSTADSVHLLPAPSGRAASHPHRGSLAASGVQGAGPAGGGGGRAAGSLHLLVARRRHLCRVQFTAVAADCGAPLAAGGAAGGGGVRGRGLGSLLPHRRA